MEWGVRRKREGEREREERINRVRNRALEIFGNVGDIWKWCGLEITIGEKDTRVFQTDKMNRRKIMPIKWDIHNLGRVSNSSCSVLQLYFS
jgi:hypothetical protein